MNGFELGWRFIVERAVRPLNVIEFDVVIHAFYELTLGSVLCTIDLLSLHGCKEGLHNSVVMRLSGSGKRLDDLVHPKQLTERF